MRRFRAGPFAGHAPKLVVTKPICRIVNNGVGNCPGRIPVTRRRVIAAERRCTAAHIKMGEQLPSLPAKIPQSFSNDINIRLTCRYKTPADNATRNIPNPNSVFLFPASNGPFPARTPITENNQAKIGPFCSHTLGLFVNRQ